MKPPAISYVRSSHDIPPPKRRGRPRKLRLELHERSETPAPQPHESSHAPAQPVAIYAIRECTFVQSTATAVARECENLQDFLHDPGKLDVLVRRVGVTRPSAATTYEEITYPNGSLPRETNLLIFNAKDFPPRAIEDIWKNVRKSIEAQYVIFLSFLPGDHNVLKIFKEPFQIVRDGMAPEDFNTAPEAPRAYVVTAEYKRNALGAILKEIRRRTGLTTQVTNHENAALSSIPTPVTAALTK